jgi:hypothetical protein
MPELSKADLAELIERARAVANVCERHGEMDGLAAARSQERAFRAELASRD